MLCIVMVRQMHGSTKRIPELEVSTRLDHICSDRMFGGESCQLSVGPRTAGVYCMHVRVRVPWPKKAAAACRKV